jgi:hypothetical protein
MLRAKLLHPGFEINLQAFPGVITIDLQVLQENLLKIPISLTEINGGLGVLPLGKQVISIQAGNIGDILILALTNLIGLLILLLNNEQLPGLRAFLIRVEFGDALVGEDPEDAGLALVGHVSH